MKVWKKIIFMFIYTYMKNFVIKLNYRLYNWIIKWTLTSDYKDNHNL